MGRGPVKEVRGEIMQHIPRAESSEALTECRLPAGQQPTREAGRVRSPWNVPGTLTWKEEVVLGVQSDHYLF